MKDFETYLEEAQETKKVFTVTDGEKDMKVKVYPSRQFSGYAVNFQSGNTRLWGMREDKEDGKHIFQKATSPDEAIKLFVKKKGLKIK